MIGMSFSDFEGHTGTSAASLVQLQINKLLNKAERMHERAVTVDRDFSPEEQTEWDHIMAKPDGQIAQLQKRQSEQTQMANEIQGRTMYATQGDTSGFVFDQSGTKPYVHNAQPNLILPKLAAFKGGGNRQQAASDAFMSALWFMGRVKGESESLRKFEARGGSQWLATQNENNPQQGGYLVFPEFANAVMVSRQQVGILRRLARVVTMTSDTFSYPKATDSTNVTYPGEEGSISASNMQFARVNLTAKKRAVYSLVSNELREDNAVALMDLLASDMGYVLAKTEDAEAVVGDGTSAFGNVRGIKPALTAATASIQAAQTGHDTWPELDYSDFGLLMAKLPAKYRVSQNLKFLCHPAFKWGVMDRLALAQGGALAQTVVDGVPQDRFLGYEVVLSEDMPSTTAANTICCVFGNFDRAVLEGERDQVRIAMSEHIAFQSDQVAVRATVRYDTVVHEAGDTSTAGAIVALATAS